MEVLCHQIKGVCLEIYCVGFCLVLMGLCHKISHISLDPLGRKKKREEDPGSGGKGFPSHSAVVVSQCLLLELLISHISAAMCKSVVASVVV
jgi:hypothetical protein